MGGGERLLVGAGHVEGGTAWQCGEGKEEGEGEEEVSSCFHLPYVFDRPSRWLENLPRIKAENQSV